VNVPAINAAVAQWNTVLSDMPCPNVQFTQNSSFPALTIKTITNGDIQLDGEWDKGFVLGGKHHSGEIRINLNSGVVPCAPHLSAPAFDLSKPGYSDAIKKTVLHELGHSLGLKHYLPTFDPPCSASSNPKQYNLSSVMNSKCGVNVMMARHSHQMFLL
jgi:predicted Zn-dependent protease